MPHPSIKDVARAARVSVATVSRTLNAPGSVRTSTAQRVHAAITKLGYRPNLVGRNLRAGRTRAIGAVLPTLRNAVFAECLEAIERAGRRHDYTIMLTTTDYEVEDERVACERLLRHRVDGLILTVGNAENSPLLDRLERERVPTVLVYNPLARGRALTVSVDNRTAAREAIEHLVGLGHRRIAMLTGTLVASDRAVERHRGYVDALRAAGLAPCPLVELPRHTESSMEVLQRLFDASRAPTALFCSNDLLAISAMRDLRALGLAVPRDVSVVGFDGIALGQYVDPPLTTVEQPSGRIGAEALELLVGLLEGRRGLRSIELPHRLRLRGSTQAPQRGTPAQAGVPRGRSARPKRYSPPG